MLEAVSVTRQLARCEHYRFGRCLICVLVGVHEILLCAVLVKVSALTVLDNVPNSGSKTARLYTMCILPQELRLGLGARL